MPISRLLTRCQPHAAVGVRLYAAEHASASAGHAGGMKLWKKLSMLVALPAVSICMINAFIKEREHMKHFERPEFRPYEHLRIRTKKFPWGDGNHSLFHSRKYNALPEGYEELEDEGHGGHH